MLARHVGGVVGGNVRGGGRGLGSGTIPLREDGSMWRGSCGIDPLRYGQGEEVDSSRHEILWRNMSTCPSVYCV
ncbi:MAG: hypothetical protein JZU67_07265, partial [Burkholderiaceae bacterium]|nr:hypothetical protein [Burkholderiaceae bacterium]